MTPLGALTLLVGYLLGGIPSGLLLGRLARGVDVRERGSGNTGATNVLRTLGLGLSAVVLLADAGKAALAVLFARGLGGPAWLASLAGLAAVAGHCWSPYLGLRGGKGVASTLGACLVVAPAAAVVGVLAMAVVVVRTRYVSLGSLAGVAAGSLALGALVAAGRLGSGALALLPVGPIVLLRHRENVARLRAGAERRLGWPVG